MIGIYFIIAIASAAALVEWYKKGLRGMDGPAGRRESKAGAVEVSAFAAVASVAFGSAFSALSDMHGFCIIGGVSPVDFLPSISGGCDYCKEGG